MSGAVYSQAPLIDDNRARRNTILLSAAHALYGMNAVLIIASGGLIGQMFAADKGLATLPVSTFATGAALVTVPAALFMRRVGRRVGFLTGAAFGLSGALVALYAIYSRDFWLFTFATFLTGGYQAFAQHYRFAAADVASESFKAKAIAWVLIGGLFAAVLGPMAIIWTKSMFEPVLFAGSYLAAAVFTVMAMGVLAFIDLPVPRDTADGPQARPLMVILRQQKLVIAILCGMVAYGIMNLMMTASPLAMVDCGFSIDAATYVIQWHVLAMYMPSFFTGHLINRYGTERVIAAGMVMLVICAISALSGIGLSNFGIALVLLGVGWNFGFVGATALVTDCYYPTEKNKVQAFNDLCVFGTVACASFTSGKLLETIGWDAISWCVIPLSALTLLLVSWLVVSQRRIRPAT